MRNLSISERCRNIDASGIRKVFDLAAQRKAQGANLIDFSIGQPDFNIPEPIKRAACDAILSDKNSYTVTQGIPELREKISAYYKQRFGKCPEGVIITSGVSGGLVLALLATCQSGDEVIFVDPYFVMYKHLVTLTGAKSVIVDGYPDFDKLPVDKIADAITKRTKIIIINSPSNPTGCTYSANQLKEIAELAIKNDILIISDEIYHQLCYDYYDDNIPSIISYAPEHTLLLDGFSKNLAMTGWRIGYAAGPAILIEQMAKLQQYTFVCAPAPLQYGALEMDNCDISPIIEDYRKRRDLIYYGLRDKFDIIKPSGGFYIFPQAPGGNAETFCRRALENDVLVIPGNVFSEKNTHFRISYARDIKTLEEGIIRLNQLV